MLRAGRRYVILPQHDVAWIEADGNYVVVHARTQSVRTRARLYQMLRALGPSFAQVHRSAVVNLDHVVELFSEEHGDLRIVMRDGVVVRGSREYRAGVQRFLRSGQPSPAALERTA